MLSVDNKLQCKLARLEKVSRALEVSKVGREKLENAALASSDRYYKYIEDIKGFTHENNRIKRMIIGPAHAYEEVFDHLEKNVMMSGIHATKRDMSFIPLGGLYTSAIADYLTGKSTT